MRIIAHRPGYRFRALARRQRRRPKERTADGEVGGLRPPGGAEERRREVVSLEEVARARTCRRGGSRRSGPCSDGTHGTRSRACGSAALARRDGPASRGKIGASISVKETSRPSAVSLRRVLRTNFAFGAVGWRRLVNRCPWRPTSSIGTRRATSERASFTSASALRRVGLGEDLVQHQPGARGGPVGDPKRLGDVVAAEDAAEVVLLDGGGVADVAQRLVDHDPAVDAAPVAAGDRAEMPRHHRSESPGVGDLLHPRRRALVEDLVPHEMGRREAETVAAGPGDRAVGAAEVPAAGSRMHDAPLQRVLERHGVELAGRRDGRQPGRRLRCPPRRANPRGAPRTEASPGSRGTGAEPAWRR